MKLNAVRYVVLGILVMSMTACSTAVRKPRLLHPGPAHYQRGIAQEFDPYPLNDLGPPIVGGRPREFQKPDDEVTRSRQQFPLGPSQPVVVPRY